MDRLLRRLKLAVVTLAAVLVPLPVFADASRDDLLGPRGDALGASLPARAGTWISLAAFARPSDLARSDMGVMAAVGIAFDRLVARSARGTESSSSASVAWADGIAVPPGELPATRAAGWSPLTRDVARRAVAAAWRAAGLGIDDARLDSIVSRARWSALLPETRLRATRLLDDRVDEAAGAYSPYRQNLWLEARLTFRLDRLLYADAEPSLERLRIARAEARTRLAGHVLDALGHWRRAWVQLREVPLDSPEAVDAGLRLADAEAELDVLTGGWFGSWRARADR